MTTTQFITVGEHEGLFDAQGRFVPKKLIRDVDLARHDLVLELVERARAIESLLVEFKTKTLADIDAFANLSAEKYATSIGGKRGNITLTSHDGRYRIQRAVADKLVFDERLQAAKTLVDECVVKWCENGPDELRAIVEHAFQTDKTGKISTERTLSLRKLSIDDEKWQRAMTAIADAIHVESTSTYVRIYERIGDTNEYRPIALDVATARIERGAE